MRGFGSFLATCALLPLLAAAGAAHAATYYVRNGGNDNADGRSHGTAWATISKVNAHSFATGDSVLFHEGHVFTAAELDVDWSGTSSNPAVIGAYYVENGTARRGLRGTRPTFDGKDQRPSTRWIGLLNVLRDHVRVENLAFVNSEGMGVRCKSARFVQAVNVVVTNVYDAAIRFDSCPDGLIENSRVSDAARSWPEDGSTLASGVRWASAIVAHHQSSRTVIRNNIVTNVFGEGINVHHGTADATIEDNFVFAARAAGIYVDAAPSATIRRNVVVGTSNRNFWRYERTVGPGIVLSNEPFHYEGSNALSASVQSRNTKIYSNVVAYTYRGIQFWGSAGRSFDNTRMYNNSLIDNEVQFATNGSPMPGSEFVNNILYSATAGAADSQVQTEGLTARNNYFSRGNPGAPLSHASNVYAGLDLARMTGWRNIDDASQVSRLHFAPKATSSTNGKGARVQTAAALATDVFNLDLNAQAHNDPVDMGAIRRAFQRTPKGPRGLGAQMQ